MKGFIKRYTTLATSMVVYLAVLACSSMTVMAQDKTIYDFTALDIKGRDYSLAQHRGKVLLIVNTASKCGLTPQFEGLEALHRKYADNGLVIIGFPCDQFGGQELDSNEATESFCQVNYGVSFTMMSKIKVNGDEAHEIYRYLKSKGKGLLGDSIKWNFTKFLVSRDGSHIERYAPTTKPEALEADIRSALGLEQ